jgi:hypothetical protein
MSGVNFGSVSDYDLECAIVEVKAAAAAGLPERVIIDSTHLRAHRTAASLLQEKGGRGASDAPKAS